MATIQGLFDNDDDDFQPTSSSHKVRATRPTKRTQTARPHQQTSATSATSTTLSGFDPATVFVELDPTNLIEKVHDESEARRVFEWLGMLPRRERSSAPQCDCGRSYGTVSDPTKKIGWRYRCKSCGSTKSALTDTWFQGSHLNFYQHLKLLVCYISGCTAKQIVKFTKIQSEAVTQWTTYAKEVMQVCKTYLNFAEAIFFLQLALF